MIYLIWNVLQHRCMRVHQISVHREHHDNGNWSQRVFLLLLRPRRLLNTQNQLPCSYNHKNTHRKEDYSLFIIVFERVDCCVLHSLLIASVCCDGGAARLGSVLLSGKAAGKKKPLNVSKRNLINNGCHEEASVEAVGFEIHSLVESHSQFAPFILHLTGLVLYNHHLHTHTCTATHTPHGAGAVWGS